MSLSSIREIAAIHEIAAPWLKITTYSQARNVDGMYPEGPYSFQATLNITEEVARNTPAGGSHREARVYLLGRVEDAMEALETAGWHLDGDVSVTIRTPHQRMREVPSLQGGIYVTVNFAVDRDRSDEEMALDPDVVAGKIFATWERGERP